MINNVNKIFKFIFISWIVLFGLVSNHPECRTLISDFCLKKNLPFSIILPSVLSSNILALNSMTGCKDGVCCEEKECNDEENILISGQYPDKIKQVLAIGNKTVFSENKSKNIINDSHQDKIFETNPIYILTQSFLC